MVEFPLSPSHKVEDAVYFLFKEHALFGRTASTAPGAEPLVMLDNANWAKLLLGAPNLVTPRGSFRRSDIDLTFAKAKKSERRLDYAAFLQALALVAFKKFPEDSPIDAFSKLCGRHLFGVLHNQQPPGPSLPSSASAVACSLLGVVALPAAAPSSSSSSSSAAGAAGKEGGAGGAASPLQQLELRSRALGTQAGERNKVGGIFDKLSSVDTFTGVYRKRYDEQGRLISGGINGYSGDISGNIRDVKELLRTDIRANNEQFKV